MPKQRSAYATTAIARARTDTPTTNTLRQATCSATNPATSAIATTRPPPRRVVPPPPGSPAAACSTPLKSGRGTDGYVRVTPRSAHPNRSWVVDDATPHHDIGLLVLDRFPHSQATLAREAAPIGEPLRTFVVEVGDELDPDDPE